MIIERRTLSNGRVVERKEARDKATGASFYSYRQVSARELAVESLPPDPSVFYEQRDYTRAQFAGPARNAAIHRIATMGDESLVSFTQSPGERFARYLQATGSANVIELVEASKLDTELAALARSGSPELAKFLGSLRTKVEPVDEPNALFDVGNAIRVSPLVVLLYKVSRETLIGYLTRHKQGDFGTIGGYEEPNESSEAYWAAPYHGVEAENRASVYRQNGIIRSRFEVTPVDATRRRSDSDYIEVATRLASETGREPVTAIVSSRDSIG